MYSSKIEKSILIFALGQLDRMGGVQRSYQLLTGYLVNHGWRVEVFGFAQTLSDNPSPLDLACPLPTGVKVRIIPSALNEELYESLIKEISEVSPSVILVVNSSSRAVFFSALAKQLNIPLVYSMRGSTEYCLRYLWPCRSIFELPFKVADAVHLLMPSYKDILEPAEREKVTTIPSQIEPARSFASPNRPDTDGRYKVIYSGRLSFEKQLQYLILAFADLAEEFSDWDLQIIGNGPLEEKLKKQAQDCGVADRIEWLSVDNTEAMYELYPKAHLKVLPSEYEGCPMALREAMAHGLPVIAYDTCSGSNEIIEHGVDGLLATAKEPVSGLANAMRDLMSNSQKRVIMGKKAIEKAACYLPEPINQQWEALLSSVIERKYTEIKSDFKTKKINELLIKFAKDGSYGNAMIFEKDKDLYKKHREEFLTVYGHRLFDDRYYLETYLDVKISGQDSLLHYLSEGWKKGYNPSPEFDTRAYQELYMKNADNNICPLYHFYTEGAFRGCFPIAVNDEYFEKWPGRKPKNKYSVINDLSLGFKN
ncbi:glycosyltransferase [Halomonas sp. MG34]|nr:glycosyltransferase [Halomonas sp. MG34]